jgi:predicted GNAT family acetyltransferase
MRGGKTVHATYCVEQPDSVEVRRLNERDRLRLAALLDGERGYSLFLAANLGQFGLRNDFVRYWAAFRGGQMRAALMMVRARAALYAPPGADVGALATVAANHGIDFTMGRPDLVEAMIAANPQLAIARREDHVLAELTLANRRTAQAEPRGGVARRARATDIEALAQLYTGAAGFEGMTREQIRGVMHGRVRSLRTYVVEMDGRLVAAASTNAETHAAAMVGGVWTAPAWRGRGFSTAVTAAISDSLLASQRVPYLFYLIDNAPAARVYAKVGYRPIGHWTVVYFDRHHSA